MKTATDLVFLNQPKVALVTKPNVNDDRSNDDQGLQFSEAHFNVHNIKMRVFEKKSN
jgi:hypothetical protein